MSQIILATRPARDPERANDDIIWIDAANLTISRGSVIACFDGGKMIPGKRATWGVAAALLGVYPHRLSHDQLLDLRYGEREDGGPLWAMSCAYLVMTWVRRYLTPLSIEVRTEWRQGYAVTIRPVAAEMRKDAA